MIREIDLSSKEAYLAWVQEWKGWWKATVKEIRDAKRSRLQSRSSGRRNNEGFKSAINLSTQEWYKRQSERSYIRMDVYDGWRAGLKDQARILHELRMRGRNYRGLLRIK